MLKKIYHLNKSKDIKEILKAGKSSYGHYLLLKFKSSHLKTPRFAFIVSTKVSKSAVKRNLIRRRLAEIIKQLLPQMQINCDCVILASPKMISAEGKILKIKDLKAGLLEVFKKAQIIK